VSGLLTLIAAGEPSKVPFYVSGAVLAAWAVSLSVIGLRRPEFPGTPAASRATMAITAVLVLATMATAVTTASKPEHAEQAGAPAGGGATLEVSADPSGRLAFEQKSLTARAGRIEIDFVNRAPLMHDVRIEGPGGRQLGGTRQITNSQTTATVTLQPGRYTFYCSVPGHRQAGMQGRLTVS
jgi:plastocyanin